MHKNIAIMDANSSIGREILTVLAERDFPLERVTALVEEHNRGKLLSYGLEQEINSKVITDYKLKQDSIVCLTAETANPPAYIQQMQAQGGTIIDDTTYALNHLDNTTLVVPTVNAQAISGAKSIIANPDSTAIMLLKALQPLHAQAQIKRIVASTYQSVSGAGKAAMDELYSHTKKIFEGEKPESEHFKKTIVFNVLPQTDTFMDDGNSAQENDITKALQQVLDPQLQSSVTCVYVPTFVGCAISVNLELQQELTPAMAQEILSDIDGLLVMDRPAEDIYATPVDCKCDDNVYISRIRQDTSIPHGLNLWIVADNLRIEASNMVDIAMSLAK